MDSVYKLNKQCDSLQPWHTPFPILNQSIVPCLVTAVASWPAYKFLGSKKCGLPFLLVVFPFWCFEILHLLKNFPPFVLIHTVQSFSLVNVEEIDVFMEISWFSSDLMDVGNMISASSAFSKSSLNIWKFLVHLLLKPSLGNFEHYFTSMWNECNCVVVWTFFGIAFLWEWNENWPFGVLWPLLSFPNLLAYWVQHFNSIIFQDLK